MLLTFPIGLTEPISTDITTTSKSSGIVDAFVRLRVSQPETIFDSKFLFDKQPLFWSEAETDASGNAAATWAALTGITMHVEAGDTLTRQTRTHWKYIPGKSQRILMTGVLDTGGGGAGVFAELGIGTAVTGLFFELDATTLGVTLRNNSQDTTVTQANWNIDKLDGTGVSGYTINKAKAQIFFIEFEWLGVGDVWFGIMANGTTYYCHRIANANALTAPFIATPNLPVRYKITTSSATANMVQICCSVQSEGGAENRGIELSKSTGLTIVNANTASTIYAICGIKLKAAYLGANVNIESLDFISTDTAYMNFFIAVNPTIAGVITWADVSNSAVQFGTTAGASPDSAEKVTADSWEFAYGLGYASFSGVGALNGGAVSGKNPTTIKLGSTIAGVADIHMLCIQVSAGTDIAGGLSWRES